MKEIVAGIDIGGTNTVFGIVDKQGNIIQEESIPTKGYKNVNHFVNELSNKLKILFNKVNKEYKLKGVGIGAPNANFYKGTIENAPNLEWKGIIPFSKMMEEKLNVPVWLTNDANAATLGEMLYGGAKNMRDFLFITLGTGLGSGIVSNGKLIYGHDGFAGEIGHTIVVENGRLCGCGRKGCLETYASASGIKQSVIELLSETNKASILRDYNNANIDSKLIYESAKKGDKISLEAFDFTGKILGKALANSVAYTSPEAIFLFGGLANAGDLLLKPVKESMEANLFNIYKNKVQILLSQLKGNNVAILGASALVWSE
ncbi:MAG: ROK family protein [Bacteroidales bacterium]|nr:ROK family protein [Bacteroidales bacterium]